MKFPHMVLAGLAVLSPWLLQVQGSIQQDIASDISKADSFYYQGQYTDALNLLTQLDGRLNTSKGSDEDKAKVKRLLGLTEVALGDNDNARARFVEFCTLNPNEVLDELQYPRKVITVFQEARQECAKCVQICARAEALVASGDVQGALQINADTKSCGCTARNTARDDAALQHGRELMTQGKYPEALKEFQLALTTVPDSAARREAVITAQAKVNAAVETDITEWRSAFLSRDFEHAAATYDRIRALDAETTGPARDKVAEVAAQYKSTFEGLAKSWDAACSKNDKVALDTYRGWGKSLDPNRTIQPAILDRMVECSKTPAPTVNTGK